MCFSSGKKKNQVLPDITITYTLFLVLKPHLGFAEYTVFICTHKINTNFKTN